MMHPTICWPYMHAWLYGGIYFSRRESGALFFLFCSQDFFEGRAFLGSPGGWSMGRKGGHWEGRERKVGQYSLFVIVSLMLIKGGGAFGG